MMLGSGMYRALCRLPPERVLPLRRMISQQSLEVNSHVLMTSLGNGIMHVELNRPNKMNSLDLPMFKAICATALRLQKDASVRCVILSGKGKAFCSGLNVKEIGKSPMDSKKLLERPAGTEVTNMAQDAAYLWRLVPCPVIAVVHGSCFGGGLQIALGADFRISTPDCKLSVMEAKWGIIPDMSASITLRELVRIDVAKELAMTGRVISGIEAAQLGLVTRCAVDPMLEALTLAKEISAQSPDSVAFNKVLFNETWLVPDEDALKLETELQKQLIPSWNQFAASARNFGKSIPYIARKDLSRYRNQDKASVPEKKSSATTFLSRLKFW